MFPQAGARLNRTVGLAGCLVFAFLGIAASGGLAKGQTTTLLFDDWSVQDVWLTVDPADWKTLQDNYLKDTYYPAQFLWRDERVEMVGIRSRGSGSRSPDKPNLLIAFNRYDSKARMAGLPQVILKANNQDASLMRELIAMRMFRRMGLPAPREAPARLYINGEFYGAYTLVEVLDEAFLRRNFGEDTGWLYDWNTADAGYRFEYLGDDPSLYCPALWSPKTRKSAPDGETIAAMVKAVNQSPDTDFVQVVSQYVDLGLLARFLAVENLLAESDGFLGNTFGMNNIYTYRFDGTTLFQFIPWDSDNTFGWENQPITEGIEANVLARRMMQKPEFKSIYMQALASGLALGGGAGGYMEGLIDRYQATIGETARRDPHKQCMESGVMFACGAAEFDASVEKLRSVIRERAVFVAGELERSGHQEQKGGATVNGISNTLFPGLKPAVGSLVNLFGSGLAGGRAEGGEKAPTKLNEVVVTFDGARGRLLLVEPDLIVAQAPADLAPGPVDITVYVNGLPGKTYTGELEEYSPAMLVVTHGETGEEVTPQSPARLGEKLVVHAAGLGAVNPSGQAGETLSKPGVSVGGVEADVSWSGVSPDAFWLYQVWLSLGQETPEGGSVTLQMTIGGKTSTISIAVSREPS